VTPEEVPPGPLLVDTDVVSYWALKAPSAGKFEALTVGRDLAISFATYGELLAIGHRARWQTRRLEELRQRMRGFVVLPYSAEVAEIWARMHAKLSGHLHRGGTNDLWTAACAAAMKPRLPVVTNNLKDFQAIASAFPEIRLVHPDI